MKKVFLLILVLALSLALFAGCSKAPTKAEEPQEAPKTAGGYTVATTDEVKAALDDDASVVVDARINSAFIGWKMDGVARGGHIKGATDFSARWLVSTYDDKENLEEETRETVLEGYLKNKGISSDKKVIVYDANGEDAKAVADYFKTKGVTDIKVYDVNEWAKDDSLDMVVYENYDLLVPAAHVNALVSGEKVEELPDNEYKFFNVAWGEIDQSGYLDGHVPGSVHVNTDWFEPEELDWMLAPDADLLKLMLKLGVTTKDHIIVTGPEPMAATRFAVILRYMGVEDVRVMTGGLVEYSDLGFKLAGKDEITEPVAVTDFGATAPMNPDLIDTQEEVAAKLSDPKFKLVDNRTWEEYIGESSGYSYHDKMGRIPGAIFGYAGKISSSSVSYYRNIDKTMRNADEVRAMWAEQGIDEKAGHLSFMCGSGWRAAEILWYSQVMGAMDTSLYSDGWIGWSNNGRPSETGEPAK